MYFPMNPRRRPRPAFQPLLPVLSPIPSPRHSRFRAPSAQLVVGPAKATRITVSLPKPLGVSLAERKELSGPARVVVAAVDSDGAASGLLHVGDVVVGLSEHPAQNLQHLVKDIRAVKSENVTLVLERDVEEEGKAEERVVENRDEDRGEMPKVVSDDIYVHEDKAVGNMLAVYLREKREGSGGEYARKELLGVSGGIVRSYGKRGSRGEELIFSLLHRLKRAQVPLDHKFYNVVMWSLIAAGAAEKVERVFEEVERPNVECFTTLVKALSMMKRPDDAMGLLKRMRKEGVKPNIRTYNALIASCVKGGKLEKARSLFSEMLVDEIRPNAVSWNIIINWHVQQKRGSRRLQGALKAFADMKASGVSPNEITFTTIMKAYAKSGLLNKAEEVFAEMKLRLPTKLDTGVYNTLLVAYAARLDWRRCLELLDEMDGFYIPDPLSPITGSGSWGVKEGVPSHSSSFSRRRPWLLDGSRTDGFSTNADGLHRRPSPWDKDVQCLPDALSFSLAVKACASAGRPDKAQEIFEEMMERGFFPPPGQAVVSLMRGYAKAGMLKECFSTLKNLKKWGIFPEQRMLSSLMHGCLVAGQPSLGLSVYSKLKGLENGADIVTQTLLVKAYGMLGEMDKMLDVMKGLRNMEGGEGANVVTFNALIECSLKAGRMDLALEALDEMLSAGISMNRNTFEALTYPIHSARWTENGVGVTAEGGIFWGIEKSDDTSGGTNEQECLEYLIEVSRRVKEGGGKPNGVLYWGLLKGCLICEKWKLGLELVRERERGEFTVSRKDANEVRRLEDECRARGVIAAM